MDMRKLFPTSIPLHQRYVKLISIPNKIQVITFSSDFIILPRSYRFEKVNNQTDIHVTSLYDIVITLLLRTSYISRFFSNSIPIFLFNHFILPHPFHQSLSVQLKY